MGSVASGVVSVVDSAEPEISVTDVSEGISVTSVFLLLLQDFAIRTIMMIRQIRETAARTYGRNVPAWPSSSPLSKPSSIVSGLLLAG